MFERCEQGGKKKKTQQAAAAGQFWRGAGVRARQGAHRSRRPPKQTQNAAALLLFPLLRARAHKAPPCPLLRPLKAFSGAPARDSHNPHPPTHTDTHTRHASAAAAGAAAAIVLLLFPFAAADEARRSYLRGRARARNRAIEGFCRNVGCRDRPVVLLLRCARALLLLLVPPPPLAARLRAWSRGGASVQPLSARLLQCATVLPNLRAAAAATGSAAASTSPAACLSSCSLASAMRWLFWIAALSCASATLLVAATTASAF